jgi:hypothetical protein
MAHWLSTRLTLSRSKSTWPLAQTTELLHCTCRPRTSFSGHVSEEQEKGRHTFFAYVSTTLSHCLFPDGRRTSYDHRSFRNHEVMVSVSRGYWQHAQHWVPLVFLQLHGSPSRDSANLAQVHESRRELTMNRGLLQHLLHRKHLRRSAGAD